jgi:hypothetical protein
MRTDLVVYSLIKEKISSLSNLLRLDAFVKKLGRKLALSIETIISIACFWKTAQIETKKKTYELLELQGKCSYKTMVVNLNRWYFLATITLGLILKFNRGISHPLKHTDATAIPVCLKKNGGCHKTMSGLASWSHDGKDHYFGLSLHLTSDLNRNMLTIKFTTASQDVREVFLELNKNLYGLFVADAGYVSTELEQKFGIEGKRRVLIAPRKNMKKLATYLDILIYNTRMTIELNFRSLKMFYGLVTSLPRSVDGYLANYAYSLLAYAIA